MTKRLTVQDRALIATRYEMWQSVVEMQRWWWRSQQGKGVTLDAKTIKNCHQKLMITGSICDIERSGRPLASRSSELVDFVRNPGTSIRKVLPESGLTYYTVHSVLIKDLHYHAWKPHLVQQIFPKDWYSYGIQWNYTKLKRLLVSAVWQHSVIGWSCFSCWRIG